MPQESDLNVLGWGLEFINDEPLPAQSKPQPGMRTLNPNFGAFEI